MDVALTTIPGKGMWFCVTQIQIILGGIRRFWGYIFTCTVSNQIIKSSNMNKWLMPTKPSERICLFAFMAPTF